MSPRDLVYVGHMLDMAKKAVAKATGLTHDSYDTDENLRLALTHLVQVVGEAGRNVSREFCGEHPEIPWQEIVGMRHKVVHDYLGVDMPPSSVYDSGPPRLAPLDNARSASALGGG